jgi:hypothetical protein
MVEVLEDISVLESLLIAMDEGASDEKRGALNAVESLLAKKKKLVDDFEKEYADEVELVG